jgi:hypothetical protein
MLRTVKLTGALLCLLFGLASFYLAITHPVEAGGRSGLVVVGAIFLLVAARLGKRPRNNE